MIQTIPSITAPCPFCGAAGYLSEPCYADETSMAVCEDDCGAMTESYMMGEYCEGSVRAVEDWNAGRVYQ